MKKIVSIISAAACMAGLTVFPANAEYSDKVYGTMNIPYADFYSAEIESAYEVDAVSSATTSKWAMNESGKLVAGTYNDGNGTILGVTFPVEVNSSDVDKLEKYGFAKLDEKPAAYKEVSVSGDMLTVSKLIDTNGEQNVSGSAEVSTSTRYGDYQLNVNGYPEETDLYGVIVNTKEGDMYALRHLENIWRVGQLAWSAGITTKEAHGNELKYDNYASSMGKTVTSVTFITLDGYTTVDVGENYLPVKFAGEVKAEDSDSGTGKTALTLTGFPDDYRKNISVGEGFSVNETEISYTNAKPGKYTVTVTDESGKYAPMSGDFTLSTDSIPVKYHDGKLVKADDFSDEDATNFKKIQRLAYVFYVLIYVHIMVLFVPKAQKGANGYFLNILVYSVVFVSYVVMRSRKAYVASKKPSALAVHNVVCTCAIIAPICLIGFFSRNTSSVETIKATKEAPATFTFGAPTSQAAVTATETVTVCSTVSATTSAAEELISETSAATEAAEETVTEAETTEGVTEIESESVSETPIEYVEPETEEPATEAQPVYRYKNGTFEGTGEGYSGSVHVSITIENDYITAFSAYADDDDPDYFSDAMQYVIPQIQRSLSADVDACSGATYSSKGIMEAANNALEKALSE